MNSCELMEDLNAMSFQPSDSQKKIRESWIDLAKGVGILLVVWAHSLPKDHQIWILINSFHMPFFFMLSGYLYKKRGTAIDFILRKVKSLWLPFMVSSTFVALFRMVIRKHLKFNLIFWAKYIVKLLFLFEIEPILGAIWFIQVLFYAIILYDLIIRLLSKITHKYNEHIESLIAVSMLLLGIHSNFPLHGSVILNSVAFIHFGNIIKRRCWLEKVKLPASLLMIALCTLVSFYNKTSYVGNSYTNSMLFIFGSCTGSIGLMSMCKIINRQNLGINVFSYLGRHSMGIMIWEFVSFKIAIAIQILFYGLSWSQLSAFPVIYEYAYGLWVILYVFIGLYASIAIYNIINVPIQQFIIKHSARLKPAASR